MIQKNTKGFTLIEIMMALAVIGLIMAAVIPLVMRRAKIANVKATQLAIKNIKQSIDLFQADTGTYPETLKDLWRRPEDEEVAANWHQYLDQEMKDAWNQPFKYSRTPDGDNPYELYSYGPDGKKAKPNERINVWKLK